MGQRLGPVRAKPSATGSKTSWGPARRHSLGLQFDSRTLCWRSVNRVNIAGVMSALSSKDMIQGYAAFWSELSGGVLRDGYVQTSKLELVFVMGQGLNCGMCCAVVACKKPRLLHNCDHATPLMPQTPAILGIALRLDPPNKRR